LDSFTALGAVQTIHWYATLSELDGELSFTGQRHYGEFDRSGITMIDKIIQEVIRFLKRSQV
jgi:hypothetical protein